MKGPHWILENLAFGPELACAGHPRDLSIGVEQEGFLVDGDGRAAEPAHSHAVLQALARRPGWDLKTAKAGGDPELVEVHCVESSGAATVVKYDHHPHLLEIATAPAPGLQALEAMLEGAWAALEREAGAVGMEMRWGAELPGPQPESSLELFRALRWTRHQTRILAGLPADPQVENYAAGIAATQVHVGGLDWRRHPERVNALYAFEPDLLPWSLAALGPDRWGISRRRWEGYLQAFPGNPLVAFPPGEAWSLEAYAGFLGDAPLMADAGDLRAGRPLSAWPEPMPWPEFRSRVRDLQIIRPRDFGTLEFRADPCQPSVVAVLRVAALRLGLAAAVLTGAAPPRTYTAAHALWWDRVLGRVPAEPDRQIMEMARQGLRSRGLGEERFLQVRP